MAEDRKQAVEQNYSLFYRMAYQILQNRQDAEDAVSVGFIKILERFSLVESLSQLERIAFCVVIIRNSAIDIVRHEKYRVLVEEIETFNQTQDFSVEDCYFNNYHRQMIWQLLDQLPQQEGRLLRLKYLRHQSNQEIGKLLCLNPETVRKKIQRAIIKLRKIYQQNTYFNGD